MLIRTLSLIAILFVSYPIEAKIDKCQHKYNKLKVAQDKLRQGYSAKQGIKLQKKARKARKEWWQCKNTKTPIKGLKKRKSYSKSRINGDND